MDKQKLIPALVVGAVIVAGGGIYLSQKSSTPPSDDTPVLDAPEAIVEGDLETSAEIADELIEQALMEEIATNDAEEMPKAAAKKSYSFSGDPTQALAIGQEDAPITIHEYSSLSCPHCAFFHKNTLPELMTNYVDTGKARIVFHDFPLNKKAFDASMVARCVAPEKRYGFMNLLFATMNDWLAAEDHVQALSQYAVIEGANAEELAACMNRKDVADSVIKGAQKGSQEYKINSTPSFVLNDGDLSLSGGIPYTQFSKHLDEILNSK